MQDYLEVLGEVLIDEEKLQKRVAELGAEISADYQGEHKLLLICILRGGVPFLVDLSRHITVPHMMDFMAVSSYGAGPANPRETCVSISTCRPTSKAKLCCWLKISLTAVTRSLRCWGCWKRGSLRA